MRRSGPYPIMLLAAAALLYAAYLPRFYVGFFNDDASYILAAKSLLQGRYVALQLPTHPPIRRYLPGYPLFLAPFVFGLRSHVSLLKLTTVVLNLLTGALLWLFLDGWVSAPLRLLTTALWLFNPLVGAYSGAVLSDPCFCFSVVLSFWLLRRSLVPPGERWAIMLGVSLAWASWIRPVGALLLISVAVGLLWTQKKRIAIRALGIAVFFWCGLLMRNYYVAGTPTDYLLQWQTQWPWLVHSSLRWIGNTAGLLRLFFSGGVFGILQTPQALAGKVLLQGLSVGALWLTAIGAWGLRKRRALPDALWLSMSAWIVLYLLLHSLWTVQDYRYCLPVLPFLLPLVLVGGEAVMQRSSRSGRIALLAVALWTACYGLAHSLLLAETWSSRRPAESLLPRATYAWIRQSTPAEARFLSRGTTTFLYTSRYSLPDIAAGDLEEFRYRLMKLGISYILNQPFHIAEVMHEGAGGEQWIWNRNQQWATAWPNAFEPVYKNPAEGTRIFRVLPAPRFIQAFDLYLLAGNDFKRGDDAMALQRLQQALVLDPDFVRGLNADAEVLLRAHRLGEAGAVLRRALALRPTHPLTHLNLARLYRLQNKPESARRELALSAAAVAETPEEQTYRPILAAEQALLPPP